MIYSLLFVCTGNLCRSPMAAAMFAVGAGRCKRPISVASAGVAARSGQRSPEAVVSLMAERGHDLAGHRARPVTRELVGQADLVLVMEVAQKRFIEARWPALKGRVRRLGDWRGEDIPDPYGESGRHYEDCLLRIEACLADWQERLPS
ncbi:MAG: low molecular weight phosphotyrosine protein phosphatase [Alphaproteobacteria bacterium]|nr:low molecular weight phosphotyrosine protein phosphatase [Alphaproteobacteria bacterium]MDE2352071.1 low molecular weight phosphotyrosine protein phosphatase [Alphaproteobacteria bacterium]